VFYCRYLNGRLVGSGICVYLCKYLHTDIETQVGTLKFKLSCVYFKTIQDMVDDACGCGTASAPSAENIQAIVSRGRARDMGQDGHPSYFTKKKSYQVINVDTVAMWRDT